MSFQQDMLSHYPRAKDTVVYSGSEFNLHFKSLYGSYGLKLKCQPTTIKNPQVNANLEYTYGTLPDMLRISGLDNSDTVADVTITDFLDYMTWELVRSYHTVLRFIPGAAIFDHDMLYIILYLAN